MLKYALLPYLYLLAGVQCGIQQDFMDSFFRSPVPIPEKYAIAPEPSHDKHSFAVAHLEETPGRFSIDRQLHLRILNDWDGAESKGCSYVISPKKSERWIVSDLHRLANDKLMVTMHGENIDFVLDHRLYSVVVVDMRRCNLIDLPEFGMTLKRPIVVPSHGESFNMIMNDEGPCKDVGDRCRVYFNSKDNYEGRVRPFNVNFDWTTMQVKRLGAGGLLVHGRDGDGTVKVIRMHPESSHGKTLISRVADQPHMQFVSSSDLAFCWNVDPGSLMTLYCAQYDQTAKNYSLWQEVNLYEDVQLLDVRSVGKGEVVVVAKKDYCNEESDDCWELLVTKVEKGQKKAKWMGVTFPCSGEQSKLVIFGAEKVDGTESVRIRYACRNDNGYSFTDVVV